MEAFLIEYFELEDTGKAEQDTALSKEDALTDEDSSPEEPSPSDDSKPLTGAGLVESNPTANETENAVIEENADINKDTGYASASEDTAFYTASKQTEFSGKTEVEEPPEEIIQDTE